MIFLNIRDKFSDNKSILSFEVFPPKKTSPIEKIYSTLDELKVLNPAYISVTYGAGGTVADNTCAIASKIKNELNIEPLAHITCVNSSKEQVQAVLKNFKENNIENVLALRGDIVPDLSPVKLQIGSIRDIAVALPIDDFLELKFPHDIVLNFPMREKGEEPSNYDEIVKWTKEQMRDYHPSLANAIAII